MNEDRFRKDMYYVADYYNLEIQDIQMYNTNGNISGMDFYGYRLYIMCPMKPPDFSEYLNMEFSNTLLFWLIRAFKYVSRADPDFKPT